METATLLDECAARLGCASLRAGLPSASCVQSLIDEARAAVLLLQRGERAPEALRALDRVAAWAHEALHTGSWRDVAPSWRELYGLVSSSAAVAQIREGNLVAALRRLDLVSMLCGPELSPSSTAAVLAHVHATLVHSRGPRKRPRSPDPGASCSPALVPRPTYAAFAHVVEVRRLPTPPVSTFVWEHLQPSRPVVIEGLASAWPAIRDGLWCDPEYWWSVGGFRTVPVEVGATYMSEHWGQELITLGAFVDSVFRTDHGSNTEEDESAASAPASAMSRGLRYLAQHALLDQIPALRKAIVSPDYCAVTTTGDKQSVTPWECVPRVNVWLGPAGTVSCLHTDPQDNLLCQVVGHKRVVLVDPAQSAALAPCEGVMNNTSRVDPEEVCDCRLPGDVTLLIAELGPGDALFIPRGWWHHARALTVSASVNFWWG